ncbi:MAG: hypothetical protein ACRCX2_33400 [Paraclostridium sp.]
MEQKVLESLYYNRFKLLALNCFVWENLPKNIESRHIEKFLYDNGKCFFFDDDELGLMVLPCSATGNYNVYGDETNLIVNGYGFNKFLEMEKGIIIRNNDLNISTNNYIYNYSKKLCDVDIAIEMNIKQQKFPFLIGCDTKTEYSLKLLMKKIEENELNIYTDKSLDISKIKPFNLNTPYVVDKLQNYRYELEREILTFIGLNNSVEKKERLIVDEVNSNNEFIERNIDIMYKNRLDACKLINDKFGLNIQVKKNKLSDIDDKGEKQYNNIVI